MEEKKCNFFKIGFQLGCGFIVAHSIVNTLVMLTLLAFNGG